MNLNNKRKQLTNKQFKLAAEIIEQQSLEKDSLLVVQGDFHKGIIGILASKISSHYKRPTIVLTQDGVGSARSGNGSKFSIIQAIQSCSELLKNLEDMMLRLDYLLLQKNHTSNSLENVCKKQLNSKIRPNQLHIL